MTHNWITAEELLIAHEDQDYIDFFGITAEEWASHPEYERETLRRQHDKLMSVQFERFRTSHPVVTAWIDMTWVDAIYRALISPFKALRKTGK